MERRIHLDDPESLFRISLIAFAVLAILVSGGFAVRKVMARSDVSELVPAQAVALILESHKFQQPLLLPVPMSDVVYRGTPQASAYAALESVGWFEAQTIRAPYRGKVQGVRMLMTAKGRSVAGQDEWEFDDDGNWQLPLARRELIDAAELLDSHSRNGSAVYRFSWRWQPTPTGAGLNPQLGRARVPTEKVFRGRAVFRREGRFWLLTEVSPEFWTR